MNSLESARFGLDRLAQLLAALPVGVFILDGDGHAIYANESAKHILGRAVASDDDASNLGERFAAYVAGTDQLYPTDKMPIVQALAGRKASVDDMEIDRQGQRLSLEVTATPILDEEQKVVFAVAVFQDITARRVAQRALAQLNERLEEVVASRTLELARTITALEEEINVRERFAQDLLDARASAEEANRARSSFLMNVSHELRTPLNHIIGFNDLLSGRLQDPKNRRLAETAVQSGRMLLERIDHLIEFARAETDRGKTVQTGFNIDDVLRELAAAASLCCIITSTAGQVRGDEATVRKIISGVFHAVFQRTPDTEVAITAIRSESTPSRVTISIQCPQLAAPVLALAGLFGEQANGDHTRFQQQQIDFQLAVARAQARMLGGEIKAATEDGIDVVSVLLPLAPV